MKPEKKNNNPQNSAQNRIYICFFFFLELMDSHGVYRHMGDCLWKTIRHEGPKGLYKGFIPQWARYGPFTVIQFLTWEKLRELAGLKAI